MKVLEALKSQVYQNPDDLPPGGCRTLVVARGASLLSSSVQQKLIESVSFSF